jgi:outer membrane protein TolC
LKALRTAGAAAHESARISLIQYSAHAALFADVLQTQSSAADADYQIQQALAAFWSAQADLERAMAEGI